jgi:hypothetical protein
MMRMRCPHCLSRARIRTSRAISDKSREHALQCENVECAHTWVAVTEAVRTIAPSMIPNPKVYIPLSPRSPALKAVEPRQPELALDFAAPR